VELAPRGKISESGVEPFPVIDPLQKFPGAGAGVVEITVFVAVDLRRVGS